MTWLLSVLAETAGSPALAPLAGLLADALNARAASRRTGGEGARRRPAGPHRPRRRPERGRGGDGDGAGRRCRDAGRRLGPSTAGPRGRAGAADRRGEPAACSCSPTRWGPPSPGWPPPATGRRPRCCSTTPGRGGCCCPVPGRTGPTRCPRSSTWRPPRRPEGGSPARCCAPSGRGSRRGAGPGCWTTGGAGPCPGPVTDLVAGQPRVCAAGARHSGHRRSRRPGRHRAARPRVPGGRPGLRGRGHRGGRGRRSGPVPPGPPPGRWPGPTWPCSSTAGGCATPWTGRRRRAGRWTPTSLWTSPSTRRWRASRACRVSSPGPWSPWRPTSWT